MHLDILDKTYQMTRILLRHSKSIRRSTIVEESTSQSIRCKVFRVRTMSCEPEDPAHRNLQTWIRIIQILCNFILGLAGKGGITLYILTKFGYFNDLKLFDHYETLNVNVFLASSIALTLISWIGIFAGTKNCAISSLTNGLLLGGFVIATTVYVATMGIITDYTKTGDLYNQMKKEMENYAIHSNFIDTLQTTLLCCGLDGVNTWSRSYIPESCCRHPSNLACTIGSPNLQTNGCFEEFVRTEHYYAWLLYSILASSGLLEILGIILSHLQCRIINDRNTKKLAKENLSKIPRPFTILKTEHEERERKFRKRNRKRKFRKRKRMRKFRKRTEKRLFRKKKRLS